MFLGEISLCIGPNKKMYLTSFKYYMSFSPARGSYDMLNIKILFSIFFSVSDYQQIQFLYYSPFITVLCSYWTIAEFSFWESFSNVIPFMFYNCINCINSNDCIKVSNCGITCILVELFCG